jgi:thiamine-phosphate pyrophosphorylase
MFKLDHAIYAILDTEVTVPNNIDIFVKADQLARHGVDIFQLRAHNMEDIELLSTAKKLAKILKKRNKIFIINDRSDITYLSDADGLHLGETDIPVSDARKIIGKKKIIGKTCHSRLDTRRFQKEAVDYTSVGPVFKTETKPLLYPIAPDEIRSMVNAAQKTIFAIGGISLYNIHILRDYGITNAAFCRLLLLAKEPKQTVEEIRECLVKISSKK